MRKKVRKSFKQLLIENKQSLLNNKENMKEIEERIEKRHVAYSGVSINKIKKIAYVGYLFILY